MEERKLQLSGRKEATRNKTTPSVVRFELEQIKQHYTDSITSIRDMFVLADNLIENNKEQAKDIMRSQIVFLVGALDFFMHEITKFGLDKIFKNEWEQTPKYSHICIPMSVLNHADAEKLDIDKNLVEEFIVDVNRIIDAILKQISVK